MFVLLVLVFGAGFVLYGVGSGYGGLEDLLKFNTGGGGSASISKLRKEIAEHPQNAAVYLKLAHALVSEERPEEAIAPLEQYTRLRSTDAGALQELANLYLGRAQRYYNDIGAIEAELATVPGAGFALPPDSFLARELQNDPFYKNLLADLSKRRGEAIAKLNADLVARENAYERAVNALPANDASLPGVVFAWARAAEDAQDYQTAIKAYQRYLKIAPDSSLAPDARSAIKKLRELVRGQKPPSGGGG
jgi:tetratricopeptide (TPR) repeat protein